jgi:hypothetical protein
MHKKTNIFVWILPLAVLSMVFFYTSIVSFIMHPSVNYVESKQGVSFHGKITNAPKSGTNYDSYIETEIPIVNNSYTKSSKYSTESSTLTQNSLSHPYTKRNSISTAESHATIGQTGKLTHNRNSNLSSGIGLSGSLFAKTRNASLAQATRTPGFSSLSDDFSATAEISNRQSTGGADPGGDPTDPPLPLGDGFWFLLILITGYLEWKMKLITRFSEQLFSS